VVAMHASQLLGLAIVVTAMGIFLWSSFKA
jgi:hypothetical protein